MVWQAIAGQVAGSAASSLINKGIGKIFGDDGPGRTELRNMAIQDHKEFIRADYSTKKEWGERNGIHPLVMLGSSPPQLSAPVYRGGEQSTGQNIGEAVGRGVSQAITGSTQKKMNDLALERAKLENDLLRTQITSVNDPVRKAGSAYSNAQRVIDMADENIHRKTDERGLTAGSENPPPAGKRFTVGNTPYGEVYITLPASGQADEFGEVYGAIKGIEYLTKRGYVHYARGVHKAGRKLAKLLRSKKRQRPYSKSVPSKGYSKITW
jgi:hypothetical protein